MTILRNSDIAEDSIIKSELCIIGSGISAQTVASCFKNTETIIIDSGKIKFEKKIQNLNEIEEVGMPFRSHQYTRIRQLGGSANLWANQLMIMKKNILEKREWIVNDFSFPIDINLMNLYYKEAVQKFYKKNFDNINFLNPENENKNNLFLEKEFMNSYEFDFYDHFWPSKVEKFNFESRFTKKLIKSKNIRFLENFTATELKVNNETQLIEHIKIQSNKKTCKIKAKIFILACGAIENARLLLNNFRFSKIFENPLIGRYFMDHPRISLGEIKFSKKIPLSNLFGIKYNHYDFRKSIRLSDKCQMEKKLLDGYAFLDAKYKIEDENNFDNFLNQIKNIIKLKTFPKIDKSLFSAKNFEQPYLKLPAQVSNSVLNSILRKFYEKKNFFFSFDKVYVNYQSEQYPNYDSRVYLSKNEDYFNQKKVVIDWKLTNVDYKTYDEFSMILKNKFSSDQNLKFIEHKEQKITDASHHSGTTRMSQNRLDGVVDKNCKFHDINNLFISGNSIFRSTGSVNPGLTNMAMSIRLAKYIKTLL